MPQVLFVCTGNICRSPMAEGLLRERLAQDGAADWTVESAGTWTVDGRPASTQAVRLMEQRGIDISDHRSRVVNRAIMERSDLVLAMTQSHVEALRLEFIDQRAKVYLLSEMKDDQRYDIRDPYGGSLADYQACVQLLTNLIGDGLARIQALAQQGAGSADDQR